MHYFRRHLCFKAFLCFASAQDFGKYCTCTTSCFEGLHESLGSWNCTMDHMGTFWPVWWGEKRRKALIPRVKSGAGSLMLWAGLWLGVERLLMAWCVPLSNLVAFRSRLRQQVKGESFNEMCNEIVNAISRNKIRRKNENQNFAQIALLSKMFLCLRKPIA